MNEKLNNHRFHIKKVVKFSLTLLLLFFIAPISYAQEFSVSQIRGHKYTCKPSISQRLNGTHEVIVFSPRQQSPIDQYLYTCIAN